jgi:DNA-binding NtrC family response regulator
VAPDDRTERQEDSAALDAEPHTSTAHLRMVFGTAATDLHRVEAGGSVVGRAGDSAEADIAVLDSRVSRRHTRVEATRGRWVVRDLGSRNRGYLDGAPYAADAALPLLDGSVLRFGDTLFVFRVGEPPPADTAPTAAFPGRSVVAAAVRRRLEALAASTGHVLILGETGTGKEQAARFLGTATGRTFVTQNCAELGKELGRAELFGHARGAFSGAVAAHEGLVDVAEDGVLFLDEVGELDLAVQADLLRFLEDGSYRPVGSTELRTSRARVVAATNVSLDDAVKTGRFRRDLLARLRASNTPLELPPLRERRDDILDWAKRFLDELLGDRAPSNPWSAGAAECLLLYPWPENLRELRGVVRGLAEAGEPPYPARLLPPRIQLHRALVRGPAGAEPDGDEAAPDPTREDIIAALDATQGRILPASKRLGLDRRKLYRLCVKLEIDIDSHRRGTKQDT